MTPIVILGAGGHGRVVQELIRALGIYEVVGFLDRGEPGLRPGGVRVLGGDDMLPELHRHGVRHAFAAVGANALRERIGNDLRRMDMEQPSLVHPTAFLAPSARVSEGALVMARAVVGTDARLAPFAILNTGAIVDHDADLGIACHVAPGCALAGNVTVGARTLIGVGSSVRPEITIGADVVIGAGSAVVRDIEDGARVAGAPARPLGSQS